MSRGGSGSLPRYILQRVLLVIPMIWVILTVVFLVLRVAPGDPVSAALGGKLDPQALAQARDRLGFNRPLIAQYWDYLSSVAHLDFGTTFSDNQPVLRVVRDNGGATLSLTLAAFVVALVVGIPLGLVAGRYRDSFPDAVIRLFGILSYAAPIFFVGFLLQVYVAAPLGLLLTLLPRAIYAYYVHARPRVGDDAERVVDRGLFVAVRHGRARTLREEGRACAPSTSCASCPPRAARGRR